MIISFGRCFLCRKGRDKRAAFSSGETERRGLELDADSFRFFVFARAFRDGLGKGADLEGQSEAQFRNPHVRQNNCRWVHGLIKHL